MLEVRVDKGTPPLPPHINLEMAKHMMSALVGDEPQRWGIMKKPLKGKAVESKQSFTRHDK